MNWVPRFCHSGRRAGWAAMFFAVICLLMLCWPHHASAQIVHVRLDTDGSGGQPHGFEISPDGQHVVYQKRIDDPYRGLLYSVPITGGVPVRLNQHQTGEHRTALQGIQISPDSRWVVYHQDSDTNENEEPVPELWAVSVTGGVPVPLAASGHRISNFAISPSNRYVVYSDPPDLYSIPITGGTPTLLTVPPAGQRQIGRDIYFAISPDSTTIVFQEHGIFDNEEDRQIRSYVVPITGGTPIHIESPPGPCTWERLAITADSRHAVVERFGGIGFSVYSFPISGGETTHLSDEIEVRLYSRNLLARQMELLPIGGDPPQVFYQRWDATSRLDTIVSVPATGGDVAVVVAGERPTQALSPITLTADGARLIYSGEDYRGTAFYSTPISQSEPLRLTPMLDYPDAVDIAADGFQMVYVAMDEADSGEDIYTLYRVPVTGGSPVKIIRQRGQINGVKISPDGGRILFRSDAESAGGWYLAPMFGGPLKLIPGLTYGEFTPDGTRIVYENGNQLFVCFEGMGTYLPYMSNSYVPPWNLP